MPQVPGVRPFDEDGTPLGGIEFDVRVSTARGAVTALSYNLRRTLRSIASKRPIEAQGGSHSQIAIHPIIPLSSVHGRASGRIRDEKRAQNSQLSCVSH